MPATFPTEWAGVGKAKMYGDGITETDIREIGERSSKRKTGDEINVLGDARLEHRQIGL